MVGDTCVIQFLCCTHPSPTSVSLSHPSPFQLQTVPNVDVYHNEKGCLLCAGVCVRVQECVCVFARVRMHTHVCDVCGNE